MQCLLFFEAIKFITISSKFKNLFKDEKRNFKIHRNKFLEGHGNKFSEGSPCKC